MTSKLSEPQIYHGILMCGKISTMWLDEQQDFSHEVYSDANAVG